MRRASRPLHWRCYLFELAKLHVPAKSFQVIQGVDVVERVAMIGLRQDVGFGALPLPINQRHTCFFTESFMQLALITKSYLLEEFGENVSRLCIATTGLGMLQ